MVLDTLVGIIACKSLPLPGEQQTSKPPQAEKPGCHSTLQLLDSKKACSQHAPELLKLIYAILCQPFRPGLECKTHSLQSGLLECQHWRTCHHRELGQLHHVAQCRLQLSYPFFTALQRI